MRINTLGADPEVFVSNRAGEIVSAIGTIGGTKEEPSPVPHGALQEDNVLAEFNIEPAETSEEFRVYISSVMGSLSYRLHQHKLKMEIVPHHTYSMDFLEGQGEKALVLGCDPDFNAYTGRVNVPPAGDETGFRTASGHIHFGYDSPRKKQSFYLVQAADIALGIPSVLIDPDRKRRELYGKAGACRIKDYGVEYRTLSNFWLNDDVSIEWAYNQAKLAGHIVEELSYYQDKIGGVDEVQRIINEYDQEAALKVCNELKLVV